MNRIPRKTKKKYKKLWTKKLGYEIRFIKASVHKDVTWGCIVERKH
jgi:hypothetical protein